jgi:hypothetical protein
MRVPVDRVVKDEGDVVYVTCGACVSLHPHRVVAVDYEAGEYEVHPLRPELRTEAAQ